LENSFVISSQKGNMIGFSYGSWTQTSNIVATNGTITNPPATGLGSISNWEDKDRIAQMLIAESVKYDCLGHAW
jgi:hypothetical protein